MGVGSATQQEQEPVWEVIQDMASKVNNCSIKRFVSNQLATWTLAAENFMALKKVCVKEVELNGLTVRLQFNPARIVSSAAKLGKEDILKRRCFLCGKNRPKEQRWIDFVTATGHEYHILVNPYPIFPEHLVIALADHSDQAISGRFEDMLALSEALHGRTIFYNGPKSGASAPDHHHFQAALNGLMPLQNDVESCPRQGVLLAEYNDANLYHYNKFSPGIFVINSKSAASASSLFYRLLDCADTPDGDVEPRINLYSWWTGEEFRVIVYFRRCHRSHHYFSLGEDHLTMSPGCADMAGVFIVPVKEEYDRITAELLGEMISEVTIPKEEQARIIERLTRTQPALSVGIMSAEEIRFEIFADGKGVRPARLENGKIRYEGGLHDELYFGAEKSFSLFAPVSFALHGVTIGVDFHWERQQLQQFAGDLKIVVDGDRLTAVNVIGVEDYLLSVISSEMRADAPEEFLKAHAVISRSWIMARMRADSAADPVSLNEGGSNADNEYIKWYDHDDHRLFDVCADDHCQRYQGLTLAAGEMVRRVIDLTWGQVLVHDGKLCDARFSKCCGGRTEEFSVCWQDKDYSYLQSLPHTPDQDPDGE